MRIARQHGAVGVEQRDRGARTERDGGEEFLVAGRDRSGAPSRRGRCRPAPVRRWAITVVQPPVMKLRSGSASTASRLRIVLEGLEVGALGDVDVGQRPEAGRVDQLPVRIEDRDLADIGQHGDLRLEHLMGVEGRHLLAEGLGRRRSGRPASRPITSAAMTSVSSNCWSKWRVSSSTVFSSSRSLLAMARSRNSPTIMMVPSEDRRNQRSSRRGSARRSGRAMRASRRSVAHWTSCPECWRSSRAFPHSQEANAYNAEMA